jgi:hypothetical protein
MIFISQKMHKLVPAGERTGHNAAIETMIKEESREEKRFGGGGRKEEDKTMQGANEEERACWVLAHSFFLYSASFALCCVVGWKGKVLHGLLGGRVLPVDVTLPRSLVDGPGRVDEGLPAASRRS